MAKPRGREHTTLTETATVVVKALKKYAGVKMIAPGVIDARRSGARFITINYTVGGFEMIISGTGVQKVAVHLKDPTAAKALIDDLKTTRALAQFSWNERDKKPAI